MKLRFVATALLSAASLTGIAGAEIHWIDVHGTHWDGSMAAIQFRGVDDGGLILVLLFSMTLVLGAWGFRRSVSYWLGALALAAGLFGAAFTFYHALVPGKALEGVRTPWHNEAIGFEITLVSSLLIVAASALILIVSRHRGD